MPSYSALYDDRDTSDPPCKSDFTCCGHGRTTATGGCRNRIAVNNRQEVVGRLQWLRNNTLARDDLQEELEDIAVLALCARLHRDQAVALATYWRRDFFTPASRRSNQRATPRSPTSPVRASPALDRLAVTSQAEPQPQRTSNSELRSTRSTEVDHRPVAVAPSHGTRPSQTSSRPEVDLAVAETGLVTPPSSPPAMPRATALAVSPRALAAHIIPAPTTIARAHPTTPASTGARIIEPSPRAFNSGLARVHSSSAETTPSPPERRQSRSSSPSLTRQNATATGAGTGELSNARQITPTRPVLCAHTTLRKALPAVDAQCLICHDELLPSQAMRWCKNSCGQNIHKSCFDEWIAHRALQNDTTPLRCCYCRQPWNTTACPCDEEPPEIEEPGPEPVVEDVLSRQWPTTPARPRCNRHKPRRTFTAELTECPICQDVLPASSTMTWCKSGCGRNFHEECWTTWRDTQLVVEPDRLPRCALCRGEWDDAACACDDEPLRVETALTPAGTED